MMQLMLGRFAPEEVNVWLILTTLLGLQLLVDMGFCVTFVRAIAFGLAGAKELNEFGTVDSKNKGAPNWDLIKRIVAAMRHIYSRLALLYLVLLSIGGTMLLIRPIGAMEEPGIGWLAWTFVIASGYINLRANFLVVLLQGLNEVALIQRWQAAFALCSIMSGFASLLAGGNLLSLAVLTHVWCVVAVLKYKLLCRRVARGRFADFPRAAQDNEVFAVLWPPTWRSGFGVFTSLGLFQFTGLVNAQFATAANSASYLFGLRLIQTISSFSQAPFYSKMALYPRLRAEGRTAEMLSLAASRMRLSLWVFVLGFVALGLSGPALFQLAQSNVAYPSGILWILFGGTFMIERYGAMHLNLYSTTNKIIAHLANGITGLVAVFGMLLFCQLWGLTGVPLGLFFGYLAFYSWYPALCTYREFQMSFWKFEWQTTAGPLFGLLVYAGYVLF